MAGVEAFLVLAMAALDFAVMARGIRTNELMPNAQLGSCLLKQCWQITFAAGEAISKLGAVVRLDAFYPDAAACIPCGQSAKEICGRIGGLLRIGGKEPQTGKFVGGGVLEQAKIRIRDTAARNDLHIHLYALTWMGHLLIWLRFVRIFRLFSRKQTHFTHDTEQALRAASVAALPQTMPEFNHAQGWISAAHVPDEFPFCFRMLVWMAVRPPGLAGKGCRTSIPALLPEVDVRPALVVFPTGAADAVFFCVLHERLPVCHVLCYTLVHERYGLLSPSCCVVTQL